ncbi:HEAT repeat domain-containing protein [Pedobacter miscanthi]|jgi:hypothetical protein|uniref:HEAT repeat domain-containing protein n=1 Tax=Pedobacter miscanthi TaxID=2259170 RepID=UPI002931A31F|nr:HEAT repeat domain-containing protein [Pedobacter miscanthi]
MNDQIKDFVDQHREEFDHLDAPAFDMARFKQTQGQSEQPNVKTIKFFNRAKWLVAASIVLIAGIVLTFFYPHTERDVLLIPNESTATLQRKPSGKENKVIPKDILPPQATEVNKTAKNQLETVKKQIQPISHKDEEYVDLKDSSSASIRLLAILKIEKTNQINNKTLDMLSKTLNHDGNTNVRLAALNVLQKYSADKYASALLISSLNKQDDPMVQLGLVSFLGKMKNAAIGEKLYALANNPETFAAVRDEAYSALLNQDKL